ncbi:Uncharacterised protein [Mycobacterium tuberculosis]|uniref:Uncharacterized protein n=1 Tax=Mycobacterium tuberculosis TaxID=1773 RepID=A0A916PBM6_MYCTX|nr:Uncharacterised protein [Mycobacterium tuberculosis]
MANGCSVTTASKKMIVSPASRMFSAERSPPDSRITGADSPVIADSSTEAMPSMISPSDGIVSPAETSTTSSRSSRDEGTDSMLPAAVRRLAIVSDRTLRSAAA